MNATWNNPPTPYPEVNAILKELLESVLAALGAHFIGMYLEGSLSSGDFDQDSDIDFVVVTDEDVSDSLFLTLQTMHDRIALMESPWAIQLEGSYISKTALRRHDPQHGRSPNIERGTGERLKWVDHGESWNIHRYILRDRGIVLVGPYLKTLIDPVSAGDLRRAMQPLLQGWAAHLLDHPELITHQGYQSYIVLSMCRVLYTLEFGDVASKRKAAQWVVETTGEMWKGLIDRAWLGRHPGIPWDPDDISLTLDFIRYTMDRSM